MRWFALVAAGAAVIATTACASARQPPGQSTLGSAVAIGPSFRVLEWNVSDSEWVKHREATRAVLLHADPDVFVLVQVAGAMQPRDVRAMLDGLRGAADTTWFFSFRPTGVSEHAVIASRDSVRDLAEFALVSLPHTGRGTVLATPPDTGARPSPRDTGDTVRTNGAMVRTPGGWVMVIGVHLTCCGEARMWREYRRQLGAEMIRDHVRAALAEATPRAAVVAGDMNLVSGRDALDTLLGSVTDGPLAPMRRADAVQDDGWTDWTWDGTGTPFNGGRLDNVLYSAGSLVAVRARVWDTEAMSPDTLRAHNLAPETSRTINRHRPVVVDFRFIR